MDKDSKRALKELRGLFKDSADRDHAVFHKAYHKSELKFYGLRTPQMQKFTKQAFPVKVPLSAGEVKEIADNLFDSGWFEERVAAIILMHRTAPLMGPEDLAWLKGKTLQCTGWGHLDGIGVHVLGRIALNHGTPVYREVRSWSDDKWMWTRRASILIHLLPGREGSLSHKFSWPTFKERLHEPEFFIRKAIGWTLREVGKNYPDRVAAFITKHKEEMSGLTMREGARNLEDSLRIPILGK